MVRCGTVNGCAWSEKIQRGDPRVYPEPGGPGRNRASSPVTISRRIRNRPRPTDATCPLAGSCTGLAAGFRAKFLCGGSLLRGSRFPDRNP